MRWEKPQGKDFRLYSKRSGEPLEGSKQGTDMVRFALYDHSGCSAENELERAREEVGAKGRGRENKIREWACATLCWLRGGTVEVKSTGSETKPPSFVSWLCRLLYNLELIT